jgi:hypothetical protein
MPTLQRGSATQAPEPAALYHVIRNTFALHTNKFVERSGGSRCCQWCGETWPCGPICLAAGLLGGL